MNKVFGDFVPFLSIALLAVPGSNDNCRKPRMSGVGGTGVDVISNNRWNYPEV